MAFYLTKNRKCGKLTLEKRKICFQEGIYEKSRNSSGYRIFTKILEIICLVIYVKKVKRSTILTLDKNKALTTFSSSDYIGSASLIIGDIVEYDIDTRTITNAIKHRRYSLDEWVQIINIYKELSKSLKIHKSNELKDKDEEIDSRLYKIEAKLKATVTENKKGNSRTRS